MVRKLIKECIEPFSFPNHLLSKKLLLFLDYPKNNAYCDDIKVKIASDIYGYTDRAPVYYNARFNENSFLLNGFIRSSRFNSLITELKTCFNSINHWMREKKIVFKLQQNGRESTGYSILNNFLIRLQGDTFAGHSSYFYSHGKENLETIAVLIREESISLEFRKEVIISMLDDNNFERCSGAGLTSLSDAADKLKKYNDFLPSSLIKLFVTALSREVALSNSLFDSRSYSAILCTYADCVITQSEIHAVHYLCGRLKDDLALWFLALPEDPYAKALKTLLDCNRVRTDDIYFQYLHEFQRRFTASNLVKFISYQLYESCLLYLDDYSSLQTFIENQLVKLGQDPEFSWSEIFTEEGNLKDVYDFMIPIAERLIDSGWLALPNQSLESNNRFFNWFRISLGSARPVLKLNFRIYPNNIALSWVKREDRRQSILEVLLIEDGLEWLNGQGFFDPKNLKDLLQCTNDLILFFKYLPESQHLSALEKLASSDFDITATLVDKLDNTINFINFYTLFTSLSQPGRGFFVDNYPKLVYSILHDILEQVPDLNNNKVLLTIKLFIRNLISVGFWDFSGIHFKKRNKAYAPEKKDGYLEGINFSCTILTNVVFYESVARCNFMEADLQGAQFIDTRIEGCLFRKANLQEAQFIDTYLGHCQFNKANLQETQFIDVYMENCDFKPTNFLNCKFERAFLLSVNFVEANLKNTDFLNSILLLLTFYGTNFEQVNFLQTDLVKSFFRKAKLSEVSFKQTELISADFEGTQLNRVNFKRSEILGVDFRGANLNEVDFSASELVCVALAKSIITNITLSVSQLPILYKQGISDFSKVRLADNWRKELISPIDRVKFFSRVIESSNRWHFLCCEKGNFRCLSKEPLKEKREAKKNRGIRLLGWKLRTLESIEQSSLKGLKPNPLERNLLETKRLETKLLIGDLRNMVIQELEELRNRRFPASELFESYSNDHVAPLMHVAQRSVHP